MVCTKWRQRQRHLVVLSLLQTAVVIMIPENSLEALKQSTSGQIMVSIVLTAVVLQHLRRCLAKSIWHQAIISVGKIWMVLVVMLLVNLS